MSKFRNNLKNISSFGQERSVNDEAVDFLFEFGFGKVGVDGGFEGNLNPL